MNFPEAFKTQADEKFDQLYLDADVIRFFNVSILTENVSTISIIRPDKYRISNTVLIVCVVLTCILVFIENLRAGATLPFLVILYGLYERFLKPRFYLMQIVVNSGQSYNLVGRKADFIMETYDKAVSIIKNKSKSVLMANNGTVNVHNNYGGNMHTGTGDINQTINNNGIQSPELRELFAQLEPLVKRSESMAANEAFAKLQAEASNPAIDKKKTGGILKDLKTLLGSAGDASAIIQAIIAAMGLSS